MSYQKLRDAAHAIATELAAALVSAGWREVVCPANDPLKRRFVFHAVRPLELRPMVRVGGVRIATPEGDRAADGPIVYASSEIARAVEWANGERKTWWVTKPPVEPDPKPIPQPVSVDLRDALLEALKAGGATERQSPRGDRTLVGSDGRVLGRLAPIREGGGASVRIQRHRGKPPASALVEQTESMEEPWRIAVRSPEQIAEAVALVAGVVARPRAKDPNRKNGGWGHIHLGGSR